MWRLLHGVRVALVETKSTEDDSRIMLQLAIGEGSEGSALEVNEGDRVVLKKLR